MPSEERSTLQKIGDAVVGFAPGIAGILAATGVGAPAAAAVVALGALGKSFGLGAQAAPEEVLQAITVDPEIRLKAQQAENDFRIAMRKADNDELFTRLADIQNARNREVEIVKTTGKRDDLQMILAIMGVCFPVIIVCYLVVFGMPTLDQGSAMLVGGLLGIIVGEYKSVFGFYFGSSQSSKDKDATMAATASKLAEK